MKETPTVLRSFHPAVERWFKESFTEPTPPQTLGWPPIARKENTLILAPTGSGKTLAAFLFAIDELIRHQEQGTAFTGVRILYLSPLKALAADIDRNLEAPLAGIQRAARTLGLDLPKVNVGVRTGDTPTSERQRMTRRPPQILITTPESLHLLLTSPRAREMLRTVSYAIVDEIHAVCGNKRGTFLALLLERLEHLVGKPFVRIGLSATQRPLEDVARFLGGHDTEGRPRPVTIVDAGARKELDIEVLSPVEDMTDLPVDEESGPTIWPAIYDRLLELIESHRSTLIFTNNRRTVERIAAELNKRAGHTLVRAHHGSVSKERRREIEEDLKAGRLPALVATGSLELGIDMGAIDLVCQVESPHSVARGLQRVGRAGHVYHTTSKGRLIPKTREDLLEMAALSHAMRQGAISPVHIPRNPLDVLAQQIVAMVAVDDWHVDDLYALVRQATPYRALPRESFHSVLDMLSGGYRDGAFARLRPRISWDRVNNVLYPLPGSRHVAIANGGAIPDTGQYPVVLQDGKTRLGEFDEEFIYERRVGETVLLGTGRWRIVEIGNDRVIVAPSDERAAQMPFWKGEGFGRSAQFGKYVGEFVRNCEDRLAAPNFEPWLQEVCALDAAAADNLKAFLTAQRERGEHLPSDRLVLLDAFRDELGEPRLALLSPYGRAFHLALLFAVLAACRQEEEDIPLAAHSDVGILLKLSSLSVERIVQIIRGLRSETIEDLILSELENSSFFGLRFRQNAARALLLPRLRPGKRTPLWLQRLRARDLLALTRRYRSFPVIVETYREVMEDALPVRELKAFLEEVVNGNASFVLRTGESPSPFTASLLFNFTATYLYEWDEPKRLPAESRVDREAVRSLLERTIPAERFDPDAINRIEARLQSVDADARARDGAELVELLRRLGDLTESELRERTTPHAFTALPDLLGDGRIARVALPGTELPDRLVAGEERERYTEPSEEDWRFILARSLRSHALSPRPRFLDRYPISEGLFDRLLSEIDLVRVVGTDGETQLCDPQVADMLRQNTLSRRRRHVTAAAPATLARLLLQSQHVITPLSGSDGLRDVLTVLAGCYLPLEVWPRVLATRVRDYRQGELAALLQTGEFVWRGTAKGERTPYLTFIPRIHLERLTRFAPIGKPTHDPLASRIIGLLRERGASFLNELAQATSEPPSRVAETLWALIWTGAVTNDSLAPVWAGKPHPALWRPGRRSGRGWAGGTGRWSLLPPPEETPLPPDALEAMGNVLLDRYGILCREFFSLEPLTVRWGTLYPVLSRLEWQGSIARGLFVSGLSGIQFARREIVEGLSIARSNDPKATLINMCDPANLYGSGAPFSIAHPHRESFVVRRHPKHFLILKEGIPILTVENFGERLTPLVDLDGEERRSALALLPRMLAHQSDARSIRIKEWDGQPIVSSKITSELEAIGFMREDVEMIFYRTYE
jgi:ATP-dependent Lhr-like helicase